MCNNEEKEILVTVSARNFAVDTFTFTIEIIIIFSFAGNTYNPGCIYMSMSIR